MKLFTPSKTERDHSPALRAELAVSARRVKIAAGVEVRIGTPIQLEDDQELTTNVNDPAMLTRDGYCLIQPVGFRGKVSNLLLNWNFTTWIEYTPLIDFGHQRTAPARGFFTSRNVKAINKPGPMPAQVGGDCWVHSLMHDSPAVVEHLDICDGESLAAGVQWTGNGSGNGFVHCTIARNYLNAPSAFGIGLTSFNSNDEVATVFEDIDVSANVGVNCASGLVYIGRDGESREGNVHLIGVRANRNYCHISPRGRDFPIPFLFRGGSGQGNQFLVTADNNTIHIADAEARHARAIAVYGAAGVYSHFAGRGNSLIGDGDSFYQGVDVSDWRGNLLSNGQRWTLRELPT